jgi:serine/threonine protein kinase
VKIADFGLSRTVMQNEARVWSTSTGVGAIGCLAPEIRELVPKGSDFAPDLWVLGEIAHQLLTRERAFDDLRLFQYLQKHDTFPLSTLENQLVGESGKSFIVSCMTLYPKDRATSQYALQHKWFQAIRAREYSSSGKIFIPASFAKTSGDFCLNLDSHE